MGDVLIVCNGMPRSASTWAFNVALGILRGMEPHSRVHHGYDENVSDFFTSAPAEAAHVVVKCHGLDAGGESLIRSGVAKTIYTWRDPADAAVSCMRMFEYDFARAVEVLEASLKLYRFHRRWGTALIIPYEEIMASPRDAIAGISDYLGYERQPAVLADVADSTSIERVKEKVGELTAASKDRLTRAGDMAYDPETLLHPNHVRDGSTGYGRAALTIDELRICDALLDQYVNAPEAGVA